MSIINRGALSGLKGYLGKPGLTRKTRVAHGVILLADAKAMQMEIRQNKADLQDDMKIGQSAVGSHEKAPPARHFPHGVRFDVYFGPEEPNHELRACKY